MENGENMLRDCTQTVPIRVSPGEAPSPSLGQGWGAAGARWSGVMVKPSPPQNDVGKGEP